MTTVAGGGWRAFPGGSISPLSAPLGNPWSPVVDAQGAVYVADSYNHVVVRIASGSLTLVAGNGQPGYSGDGGPATTASLNSPRGLALDSAGNLYIADSDNHRIRKVSKGIITTFAGAGTPGFNDGPASAALLNKPYGLAIDSADNLYISEFGNHTVRRVAGTTVTTIAGTPGRSGYVSDGVSATSAPLTSPEAVAVDSTGSLYIADSGNYRVRRVVQGTITTVAGNGKNAFGGDNGPAVSASIGFPTGIALDAAGNLYIADNNDNRVRKVSNGIITTAFGTGDPTFQPVGIAVDSKGQVYIADQATERVLSAVGNQLIPFAGQGAGTFFGDGKLASGSGLFLPEGAVLDSAGNLYIADYGNNAVRKVSNGVVTTIAGNGIPGYSGDGGQAVNASLDGPFGLALDPNGTLYIADYNNHRVRKVVPNGIITTVAGTGVGGYVTDGVAATSAALNYPAGVAVDANHDLYIADASNNRIRKVVISTGIISTIATPVSPALNTPSGVAIDSAGNLFICDLGNSRILKVSGNATSVVAGNGQAGSQGDGGPAVAASLDHPVGIAVDGSGNLYIADTRNNRIRVVSGGVITTLAGSNAGGYSGDGGPAVAATLRNPFGVTLDSTGNVYVLDTYNYRVREILKLPPSYQIPPDSLSLTFSGTEGGAAPPPQQVALSSAVPGIGFTATSSAPWLTVTGSGSIPGTINAAVDLTGMAAGAYPATITISSPNSATVSKRIDVALNVQAAIPPQLSLGTAAVSLGSLQGGPIQTGSIGVYNVGAGSLSFSATATTVQGGNWLTLTTAAGNATPSVPVSIGINADPGQLAPGTYSGNIAVTGGGTTKNVSVALTITAPNPVMVLSQSGLIFRTVVKGGTPSPQTLGILNSGTGTLSWTATSKTLSGGDWLHLSSTSGSVSTPVTEVSPVNVSVNPAGLDTGEYYAQIRFVGGKTTDPQFATVILSVRSLSDPPLPPDVQPASLIFTGNAGVSPGSQDVVISNLGASPVSFTSAASGTGFTYLPAAGTILPNQPMTLRVFPDFTKFAPGDSQNGSIKLDFTDNTSQTINVLSLAASAASRVVGERPSVTCASNLVITPDSTMTNFTATLGQPFTVKVQITNCGNAVTQADLRSMPTNIGWDPLESTCRHASLSIL